MSKGIASRLRSTRADMLGTDDEQHYWDCHEAAELIEALWECYEHLNRWHESKDLTAMEILERVRNLREGAPQYGDSFTESNCDGR